MERVRIEIRRPFILRASVISAVKSRFARASRRGRSLLVVVTAALLASTTAGVRAEGSPKAGMAIRSFSPAGEFNWRGSRGRALTVAVWYPAQSDAQEIEISVSPKRPLWHADRAAPDAAPPVNLHRYPLIVMSHGFGGAGIQLAWLGAALARRGFVAAAVNHPGNSVDDVSTLEGFALRWERARDLKAVIDGLLGDSTFGELIDRGRIGAAGFSLGGYTAITIAGGRTDLDEFDHYCSGHIKACLPPPDVVPMLKQVAVAARTDSQFRSELRHAGDSYRDERVRAIFAMAPAFGHSFARSSLASISIPVRIVVGDRDDVTPADVHAAYFANEIKGARLDVLGGGVGHFVFLDLPTSRAKLELPLYAIDPPGVDRAAIHDRVIEMAASFFDDAMK